MNGIDQIMLRDLRLETPVLGWSTKTDSERYSFRDI